MTKQDDAERNTAAFKEDQEREASKRDDEKARRLQTARGRAGKDTAQIDDQINKETARRINAELARRDKAGEP